MDIYKQTEEYTRQGLVQKVEIISTKNNFSQLKITTLQNTELPLEVTPSGIKLKTNGNVYQTFEGLLRDNSKAYSQKFFELLNQRLMNLKDEQ